MRDEAGGADGVEEGGDDGCRLVRGAIDPGAVLALVGDPDAGGNVLFVGTTRGVTDGVVTVRLEYEACESLALATLRDLRTEAMARFGLRGCALVHRLGEVGPGEASVAIAASAPHRREAFEAVSWLLERVKTAVPVWKCDEGEGGTREWIHPGDMRDGGQA